VLATKCSGRPIIYSFYISVSYSCMDGISGCVTASCPLRHLGSVCSLMMVLATEMVNFSRRLVSEREGLPIHSWKQEHFGSLCGLCAPATGFH